MIKWITSCLCLLITVFCANAQGELIDTIVLIKEPLRTSNHGGKNQILNRGHSVSETLTKQTSVFIKNYGPGSLATSSIRGGSAGHTLVLWNGLPIQNPFLGLLDLSLLDTWAMTDVALQKGGNSAMWGSGAIGGVINLQQKNKQQGAIAFKNRLSYGSFNTLSEKAQLGLRQGKWTSQTSISYLRANNDFSYKLANGEIRKQTNAIQKQYNINQDIYFTPSGNQEVAVHYWHSRANRQLPPTATQSFSEATQFDGADRLSFHYKYLANHHSFRTRAGYYIEDLNYLDPIQRIRSITHFETFLADADYEFKINTHHVMNVGFSHFRTQVSSPANYESDAIENKSALFALYQFRWFQLSGRQEYVNGRFIPFVPALAVEVPLFKNFQLAGKVSRNYRLPTLNDRFWVPGGNPNLLAESGWSQELGLKARAGQEKWALRGEISGFNRTVKNWIQWTLDGPFNINEVWSRGLELSSNVSYEGTRWRAGLDAGYDYILSTNQKATQFPRIAAGDQLFYTPVHQGFAGLRISMKHYSLHYRHQFTGATSGINENLEAFSTADLRFLAKYDLFSLEGRLNNIWNTNYRIIERRPMPGRNFELIINYSFNKE